MKDQLLAVAIQELPGILALIRESTRRDHPGQPEPTDEEVIAALNGAVASSVAKDDLWLAAHPPQA